ncbi:hypothetical protein MAPG_02025 [Magnaporthiopsis poae ATCC 64411]|uniref:Uncharacterized protein n=1 Tax=Magnaporthiopsis poae (strain ATCC 64411 / 73-15) TaxID=644358 RepID=A0A0C4DQ87_MAGP6|nr:hypothetical protein MAPG_02025 [Magnaporthiopsis poae ATCC 64411]
MHFTSSLLTGAVVALYATQIAAAPVSSRSRSSLLGARATEGCGAINPELLKPKTANIPAGTKLEPVVAPAPAPAPKKQPKRDGDRHHHAKRATTGCDGDPAHANDPNYMRCMSVPAEPELPVKPDTKKPAPKAEKPVKPAKPSTKVAVEEASPATPEEKPKTPLGRITRNRLPVSQMEDGGRP